MDNNEMYKKMEQYGVETLYDLQTVERAEQRLDFKCPPILREGIARYQMTCENCPKHIKSFCETKADADLVMAYYTKKCTDDLATCECIECIKTRRKPIHEQLGAIQPQRRWESDSTRQDIYYNNY